MNQNNSMSESFYSINNSKSEFTFIEQPQHNPLPQPKTNLLHKFDIRQSSIPQISSQDLLNKSINSIENPSSKGALNVNDISGILHTLPNQLECSMSLQNQIDCLSLPNLASVEDMKLMQEKINRLKNQQSILKQQLTTFQELINISKINNQHMTQEMIEANKFMKKDCEHIIKNGPLHIVWPNKDQILTKCIQKPAQPDIQQKQIVKHFDIKPNKNKSASQKQANALYKHASFNNRVTLVDDAENEYRVEVLYQKEQLMIDVVNYQKGHTNFVYAAKLSQSQNQKISQSIVFPLIYYPKKFTLSLNIVLLIFQQNKEKQEKNLIKIEQIRSISVPLPINYSIEPRFMTTDFDKTLLAKISSKLYVYELEICFGVDYVTYDLLSQCQWVQNKWVSLKGSSKMILIQLGSITEKDNDFSVSFKVGCRQKDSQQAIDIIEYLCFMLSL